jgi:hypothetical protein
MVSLSEVEISPDQRIDTAWLFIATKESRTAALPRGTTRTAHRRRHFNDGVRRRIIKMYGQDSTLGIIHGRSLPQQGLTQAHRCCDLLDRDGRNLTDSSNPVTVDARAV